MAPAHQSSVSPMRPAATHTQIWYLYAGDVEYLLSAPPSLLSPPSPPSPPSQRSSTKSTLKRCLDNYSENDIYTLVKKMLNWLESGHDQYEDTFTLKERLKPSHRQDGTPFTHSAVLANSDDTEIRCCDDCVCNNDYTACMGLPCYHKIISILETGSVLKATDFDVHWFVDRQHFINPPALRLRQPAVVHKAWKPAARRPKATSTARGSTRNVLTDRNDVGAGRPVGQPSDQGPIPGPSQAAVRALAPDRVSCGRKSQTACNTNNCSCRRANVLCGKWCHKGDTRCGNLKDAKLEAAQKGEYARQQTEKLSLVEQCLQQLTGVLHQSQV
ncbi:hypothetical protein E4U51_008033 [Claviceps purpurea]|nr:hypothetical protein E4U51_008033 [Claviceps purpurea]